MIGQHYTNGAVSYAPIPKCGSNAVIAALHNQGGWTRSRAPTDGPVVAVVRDPYDRYWSGVRQYERAYNVTLPRDVVRPYDEHTLPQSAYLWAFPQARIVPLPFMAAALREIFGVEVGTANQADNGPNPYNRTVVEVVYSADLAIWRAALAAWQ